MQGLLEALRVLLKCVQTRHDCMDLRLGGVESLITLPREQTHADLPADTLDRLGIGPGLLRLSIGIEDVNDLIRDLENVL